MEIGLSLATQHKTRQQQNITIKNDKNTGQDNAEQFTLVINCFYSPTYRFIFAIRHFVQLLTVIMLML